MGERLFVPRWQGAGTTILDLSREPFDLAQLRTTLRDAVLHPDGGFVLVGRSKQAGLVVWRSPEPEPLDPREPLESTTCDQVVRIGDEIFGLTDSIAYDSKPVRLVRLAGGPLGTVDRSPRASRSPTPREQVVTRTQEP